MCELTSSDWSLYIGHTDGILVLWCGQWYFIHRTFTETWFVFLLNNSLDIHSNVSCSRILTSVVSLTQRWVNEGKSKYFLNCIREAPRSPWPWVVLATDICTCLLSFRVFGNFRVVVLVGLFLVLNNLCYISLGSMLGVYSRRVPQGMIASTIFSQTSLVAAGFYTKLPPALDWVRYISPFYWTFRGTHSIAAKIATLRRDTCSNFLAMHFLLL